MVAPASTTRRRRTGRETPPISRVKANSCLFACRELVGKSALGQSLEGEVIKTFTRGTHRTVSPEDTLARYRNRVRGMGITRLGNITGLDHVGIPTAIAVRPNSRSVSVSQGKGLTLTQALASALMEAIEEFHGENLSPLCRTQCVQKLSAQACVVDYTGLCRTVKPLPDDVEIAWVEGFDLLSGENCWVPAEVVELDFTIPTKHGTGYFLADSNGLASGNHLLEAISSAICELVERDAAAIWDAQLLDQRVRRHLDLTSVHDADCRRLLQAYGRADMAVRAWNVTSDIGIPTFVCDIFPEFEDPCADLPRF